MKREWRSAFLSPALEGRACVSFPLMAFPCSPRSPFKGELGDCWAFQRLWIFDPSAGCCETLDRRWQDPFCVKSPGKSGERAPRRLTRGNLPTTQSLPLARSLARSLARWRTPPPFVRSLPSPFDLLLSRMPRTSTQFNMGDERVRNESKSGGGLSQALGGW